MQEQQTWSSELRMLGLCTPISMLASKLLSMASGGCPTLLAVSCPTATKVLACTLLGGPCTRMLCQDLRGHCEQGSGTAPYNLCIRCSRLSIMHRTPASRGWYLPCTMDGEDIASWGWCQQPLNVCAHVVAW